jgi:hypothetical protein
MALRTVLSKIFADLSSPSLQYNPFYTLEEMLRSSVGMLLALILMKLMAPLLSSKFSRGI